MSGTHDNNGNGHFDLPPVPAPADLNPDAWKDLLDTKNGEIESTLHNARVLLRNHPDFKNAIRWNDYAKRLEVRKGSVLSDFYDCNAEAIVAGVQDYLLHVHKVSVPYSDLTKRVVYVARKNSYNPLVDHLKSLLWDGIPRVDNFLVRYFGAGKITGEIPTEEEFARLNHLRRISRRWLLGAVERAFRPGSKVDNILILEGLQGARKTSALEALGGDYYSSAEIKLGDKDSMMIASSNWFVDMPDTKFMKKGNRGFITMREDTFRPPFGASIEKSKRCCIFIGSMNDYQYFDEEERRYWPVRCADVDLVALMEDRDQLWAETVAISLASEICTICKGSKDTVAGQRPRCATHRWWLDANEEKESSRESAERVQDVPWKLLIHEWWLDMKVNERPEHFTTEDIAMGALHMDESAFARGDKIAITIGLAVRSLGFTKERMQVEGVRHWVYMPTKELAQAPRKEKPRRGLFAVTGESKKAEKK